MAAPLIRVYMASIINTGRSGTLIRSHPMGAAPMQKLYLGIVIKF
jgi:hypothetical protein